MKPETSRRAVWWRASVILAAGALTYWNSLSGPFVFDDSLAIVSNVRIRELGRLARVFSPEANSPVAGRPLVNLSFAMNYAVGALEVRGYHLANVAIHLTVALLLFGIVRRTFEVIDRRPPAAGPLRSASGHGRTLADRSSVNIAFAVAMLWTLHPLNTEAVDYLTQRTESLMALFYLASLYGSIRALDHDRLTRGEPKRDQPKRARTRHHSVLRPASQAAGRRGGRIGWEAFSVAACLSGMACKESMVTAPLMIILYDSTFAFSSIGQAVRSRWRFYLALAATWTLLAALMWSGPRAHTVGFSNGVGSLTYLGNQMIMIVRYLRLAVWPRGLVINYGWPSIVEPFVVLPLAIVAAVLLVATGIALLRRSVIGFLGAWFLVTLAPTSSIVPISTEVGAERRMYLPLMALIVLGVLGVRTFVIWASRLSERYAGQAGVFAAGEHGEAGGRAPLALALILTLGATALAIQTMARNREYRSGLSLAQTALQRWPSGMAHYMVGTELAAAGRHEDAKPHLREAALIIPRAHFALGSELFDQTKLDEAIEELQAFVHEAPLLLEVIPARALLGQAYAKQERWGEAVEQFRLVLKMSPKELQAQYLLANALASAEQYDEAVSQYRTYLRARPNDRSALTGLAIALIGAGRAGEAIDVFKQAEAMDPDNADVQRNLANALYDQHRPEEAAAHAERAIRLRPADPAAHELLGRALAVQGKFEDARAQFERALEIDPSYSEAREDLRRLALILQVPDHRRR